MVTMKLKLVKGKTKYEAAAAENGTAPVGDMNHGTKVLKELVYTNKIKEDRLLVADYYFASAKYVNNLRIWALYSLVYPIRHHISIQW